MAGVLPAVVLCHCESRSQDRMGECLRADQLDRVCLGASVCDLGLSLRGWSGIIVLNQLCQY